MKNFSGPFCYSDLIKLLAGEIAAPGRFEEYKVQQITAKVLDVAPEEAAMSASQKKGGITPPLTTANDSLILYFLMLRPVRPKPPRFF